MQLIYEKMKFFTTMRNNYYTNMESIYCNQAYEQQDMEKAQASMDHIASVEEKLARANPILPDFIQQLKILSILDYQTMKCCTERQFLVILNYLSHFYNNF